MDGREECTLMSRVRDGQATGSRYGVSLDEYRDEMMSTILAFSMSDFSGPSKTSSLHHRWRCHSPSWPVQHDKCLRFGPW